MPWMLNILLAILVMGFATQLTRAFPFILFSRRKPPGWLLKGARLIPGAVMTVLVITSLPINSTVTAPATWMPWAGVGIVATLHLIFRHPLVSIFGGTGVYMALVYFIR